jgi:hypothetical protein
VGFDLAAAGVEDSGAEGRMDQEGQVSPSGGAGQEKEVDPVAARSDSEAWEVSELMRVDDLLGFIQGMR